MPTIADGRRAGLRRAVTRARSVRRKRRSLRFRACRVSHQGQRTQSPDRLITFQSFVAAWTDLIAAIIRAVGIVTVGRIAVAAETVAKFAMLMAAMETTEVSGHVAAMETTEVSGHVAATEAAAKMTAAETATMAPTTATASECGS